MASEIAKRTMALHAARRANARAAFAPMEFAAIKHATGYAKRARVEVVTGSSTQLI
jgi:hypothetical protein